MDIAYKGDIPRHRKAFEQLRREFAGLEAPTDWTALRIAPLLEHVKRLERLLKSSRFTRENARLRRGVGMFHADLVYLRTNLKELRNILARTAPERKAGKTKGRTATKR